jgi:hypothetical protein
MEEQSTNLSNEVIILQEQLIQDHIISDISGMENINEIYDASLIKKWIKLIPIKKTILFEEYNRKEYFIPIADIVLDNELFTEKKQCQKKRNTLIQFIPKISNEEFITLFLISNAHFITYAVIIRRILIIVIRYKSAFFRYVYFITFCITKPF